MFGLYTAGRSEQLALCKFNIYYPFFWDCRFNCKEFVFRLYLPMMSHRVRKSSSFSRFLAYNIPFCFHFFQLMSVLFLVM